MEHTNSSVVKATNYGIEIHWKRNSVMHACIASSIGTQYKSLLRMFVLPLGLP